MLRRLFVFSAMIPCSCAMELSDILVIKRPAVCSNSRAIKETLVHNQTEALLPIIVTFKYQAHIVPFHFFGPSAVTEEIGYIHIDTDPINAKPNEYITCKPKSSRKFRQTWDERHVVGIAKINGISIKTQKQLYHVYTKNDCLTIE